MTKRSYKKKYIIEGPGICDPSGTFLRECFRETRQSAALQAGKTAAKDIGMKAIDVGKTVAIDDGKNLVEKAANKLSTLKSQVANVMVPPREITNEVNEVIAKYVDKVQLILTN